MKKVDLVAGTQYDCDPIIREFATALTVMQDIVEYGVMLIDRAPKAQRQTVMDTVVFMNFLRHSLTTIAGIRALLTQGLVCPAYVCLRSLFETNIQLHWMLQEHAERRALLYFTWELRQRLIYTQRWYDNASLQSENGVARAEFPGGPSCRSSQVTGLTQQLTQTSLAATNREFEVLAFSKGHEPHHWYELDGVKNLAQMARAVKLSGLYRAFYSGMSRYAFLRAVDGGNGTGGNSAFSEQLNCLLGLDSVLKDSVRVIGNIYGLIIRRYGGEGELALFERKKYDGWRSQVARIPHLVRREDSYVAIPPRGTVDMALFCDLGETG